LVDLNRLILRARTALSGTESGRQRKPADHKGTIAALRALRRHSLLNACAPHTCGLPRERGRKTKKGCISAALHVLGAPGRIRTCYPLVRRNAPVLQVIEIKRDEHRRPSLVFATVFRKAKQSRAKVEHES